MVVAISLLEAPIKFRAPGVTLPVGLDIGRLVFKALNVVEIVLLLVLSAACYVVRPEPPAPILLVSVAVVLVIQVVAVRPPLSKRTDRVLALWNSAVDQMYQGTIAERAKIRAARIAWAMHRRLTGNDSQALDDLVRP
jgi:hypothetical protein